MGLVELGVPPVVFHLHLPRGPHGRLRQVFRAVGRMVFPFATDPLMQGKAVASAAISLPSTRHWPSALVQTAREMKLDFLIVVGRLNFPEELAAAFPFGLLILDHLDFDTGDVPQAFSAFVRGQPDWEPRMVWYLAGQPPRLLYRSPSTVFPLSFRQTSDPACVKASAFVRRAVRIILEHGSEAWERLAQPMPVSPSTVPSNTRVMLEFFPRLIGRHCLAACRDVFFRPQWFLALRREVGNPFDLHGFSPLFPPAPKSWADPFPFIHQGEMHLFIEEIDKASGLGSIAVMTEQADGRFSPPRTAIKKPFHLSYPFVFEWDGDVFLVPESSGAGVVDLYRATRFPLEWERVRSLLSNVRAVDPTILRHDGRWWLMTNLREAGASSWDELFLYFADSLLGKFTPHPCNPVVSNVRSARPAGRIFTREGRLYRPSQDCSGHYGRGLVINEITTLTQKEYRETVVARHDADMLEGSDSLHTYNSASNLEVVDGRHYISRLSSFFML